MTTQVDIPGYVTGRWAIDAARSAVSFQIRQAGIASVRGRFDEVTGTLVTAPDPRDSTVTATVATASVNTGNKRRDEHLQTKGFLDAAGHPAMSFTSTAVRTGPDGVRVDGELTIHGVTRPVTLDVEVEGFSRGAGGRSVVRLTGRTAVSRAEHGVTCGPAGPFLGRKVAVTLSIEAVKQD